MGKVYKNNSRNEEPIKATKDVSLEQIMKKFKTVSDEFFEEYKTKGDRNIFLNFYFTYRFKIDMSQVYWK